MRGGCTIAASKIQQCRRNKSRKRINQRQRRRWLWRRRWTIKKCIKNFANNTSTTASTNVSFQQRRHGIATSRIKSTAPQYSITHTHSLILSRSFWSHSWNSLKLSHSCIIFGPYTRCLSSGDELWFGFKSISCVSSIRYKVYIESLNAREQCTTCHSNKFIKSELEITWICYSCSTDRVIHFGFNSLARFDKTKNPLFIFIPKIWTRAAFIHFICICAASLIGGLWSYTIIMKCLVTCLSCDCRQNVEV